MAGVIKNKASLTITRICPWCKVSFTPEHTISQTFCSRKCYNDYRNHDHDGTFLNKLDHKSLQMVRVSLLNRAGNRCEGCKVEIIGKFHIHHKISYIDGGTDDLTNLEVLCVSCHGKRHSHR